MTKDAKDKCVEALLRLEMLLSLGWVVTSMGRPLASTPDHENDYCISLASDALFPTSRVAACDPDLATAITKAINQAAQMDPTFRDFEKAVS